MRKLLAGTLLMATSIGITQLVVPLHARSLGANYTEIGMLGLGYVILNVVLSIPVGRAGDRRGRVRFLALGFLTTAITFAAYSFFASVLWLIAMRVAQGATETLIWVNSQGLMADKSEDSQRGKAMGTYTTSYAIGIGIGPIIGGFLYTKMGAATFLVAGAISLISFFIILAIPPEKPKPVARKTRPISIWPICLIGFINFGIISILYTILPVYATSGLGISDFQVGLVVTMFALSRAILFLPMGRISDRVGHRKIILFAMGAVAVGLTGFTVALNLPSLIVLMLILVIPSSIIYPTILSAASKSANSSNMGYVMGVFNAISMAGWGVLPGVGGILADAYGPISPFLMSAAVAMLAVPILWKILPKD